MKITQISSVSVVVALMLGIGGCCNIPSYAPGFWNDGSTVQSDNNCYNYGNNKRTDTYAQPGRRSGTYPNPMSCSAVTAAAIADGIISLPVTGSCPGDDQVLCKEAVTSRGRYCHNSRMC